mmetsp:Transcript_21211/g.34163  ORF Transcript_21211/g.34163 Transcript_21211/m.34163 type:complete len:380 (-) Transcript_21211:240-1379(-)
MVEKAVRRRRVKEDDDDDDDNFDVSASGSVSSTARGDNENVEADDEASERREAKGEKTVMETLEDNAETILENAEAVVKDIMGFNEWQLKWFRKVSQKTVAWCLFYSIGVYFVVHSLDDPDVPPFHPSESWRVVLTTACTLMAWITLYQDVWVAVPPEVNDVKKRLLEKNLNGHFTYLTFHIIFATFVYWNTCFIAEVTWLYGLNKHENIAWARKLLKFTYSCSGVIAALGVTLAILFLKFNWYEKKWREEILETYTSRGYTDFGPRILFTHLNQTPIALLDMLVIKHRDFLEEHMLAFEVSVVFVALYGIYYISMTHANYRLSSEYPYPFLKVVLASWKSEIIFILAIVVFVNVLVVLMWLISRIELGLHGKYDPVTA